MSQTQSVKFGKQGMWALRFTVFTVAYNVAVMPALMPLIVAEFGSSVGYIQTILVLFSLVTASFAPTTENLCRFFGRTRIFSLGLALYTIGIALTALSPNTALLAVSFSFLTGLAATPLVNTPWTLSDLAFDGKAEEQATLSLTLASALGGLSGALLGGLIGWQAGWRWAFLPSAVVLIAIWLLRRSLPQLTVHTGLPIDWIGGLLSFLGLSSILVGLSLAGEFGWWAPKRVFMLFGMVLPPFPLSIVPTLIAAGVVALGLFIFWQRIQARNAAASLMRVGLLRKPGFVAGLMAAMTHVVITTGVQFNLFQFVPVVLELNPFQTALTIIPYNLTMIVVVISVIKYFSISDRISPKSIVRFGIALVATGLVLLSLSMTPQTTSLQLLPGLIVMGMGSGLFLAYISKLTYLAATEAEKPEGSGIYNPIQNLGNSLGRAILGTTLIFYTSKGIVDSVVSYLGVTLEPARRQLLISQLQETIQTLPKGELSGAIASNVPPSVLPLLRPIAIESTVIGMRASLFIALIFAAICFLLTLRLPKSLNPPER